MCIEESLKTRTYDPGRGRTFYHGALFYKHAIPPGLKTMDKFRNKYRIPSARAPFRDYSQEGLYYITICAFKREPIFGHIENHTMMLSQMKHGIAYRAPNPFHHLWPVLNHQQPNVFTIYGAVEMHGRASLRYGNPVFTTTLFVMMKNIKESGFTSIKIRQNGKMMNLNYEIK